MFKKISLFSVFLFYTLVASATDLSAYIHWIENNTAYSQSSGIPVQDYPNVSKLSPSELASQFGNDTVAVYVLEKNTIVIPNNIPKDIRFDAVMIHEMVHFMQFYYKKKFNCMEDMEKEAYNYQIKYLKQNNLELKVDPIVFKLLTTCIRRNVWEK